MRAGSLNAVLSGAIAFQLLEAIVRWDTQLVQRRHRVELHDAVRECTHFRTSSMT